MTAGRKRKAGKMLIALATLACDPLLLLPSVAKAEVPEFLFQTPEDGLSSSTAGHFVNPRGIATDPLTGHFYVAEGGNARIDEFTSWGVFIKAWGWASPAAPRQNR